MAYWPSMKRGMRGRRSLLPVHWKGTGWRGGREGSSVFYWCSLQWKCTHLKRNWMFKGHSGRDMFARWRQILFWPDSNSSCLCLSQATLFHTTISSLPCTPVAISLTEIPISTLPFHSWSPLPALVSLWKPTAAKGAHHSLLTSIRASHALGCSRDVCT